MDEGLLLKKVQGSMVGHTIGDRLGWPYETKKPEKIQMVRDGNGRLRFIDAPQHSYRNMRLKKPGECTDDSQHARALARTYIEQKKFDPFYLAGELLDEARMTTAGWGKGTKMAVREFRKFYKSYGRFGRNPTLPTSFQEGQGGGNGVAMKAHVLALWDASRCPNRSELDFVPVFEMGVMTHGFPPAVVVSAVFAEAVHLVVLEKCSPSQDVALFFETLWLTARRYEMAWNETYAKRFGLPKVKDEVSKRLELLMPCPHLPKLLNDPIAMREKIGTKCFALESVIFSIASFIRHPLDFEAGMEEVIAAGGDTDTNAAMYGALAGANGGLEIIPPAWREYNQGIKDTATLATRLYQTAKSLR